jgi:hypothetical protein
MVNKSNGATTVDKSKTDNDQAPAISAPDTWLEDAAAWSNEGAASTSTAAPRFKVAEPWGADSWAIPREFATGALFSAQKRGRTFLINEKINTNDNVVLHGTGESLLQYDLDVFACIVHQGRDGDPISFRLRDFIVDLRGAGKGPRSGADQARPTDSVGGASVVAALNSIARLTDFEIALTVKKNGAVDYSYVGRLVDTSTVVIDGISVAINDETARLKGLSDLVVSITLNPEMAVLFEKRRRVYLNRKTRSSFSKSPLVLWLYAFLRSHRNPFDLPLEYFLEKCGSASKKAEFSRMMTVARKRLRKGKVIYSSKMVKGKLHFQMQPTPPKPKSASKHVEPATQGAAHEGEAPQPGQLH